jgi:hypothetical protein
MKNETTCYDVDRLVNQLDKRMTEFQTMNKELGESLELIS